MTGEEVLNERERKIRKSNELIQKSRYRMTAQQQKIMLYIIAHIPPDATGFEEYTFSIPEFCRVCGIYKSKALYQEIKKSITGIKALETLWVQNKDGEEETLDWIQKAKIIEKGPGSGYVKITLDNGMVPYLLQLKKNFTQYELIYTLKFKSKYSLRLYELIKSVHFHELEDYEREYSVEYLRDFLIPKAEENTGKNEYREFKDFKKRVLIPAIKEINEYSDKTIEMEQVQKGKKIVSIRFKISTKRTLEQLFLRDKINKELDQVSEDQVSFAKLQGNDE